MVTVPGGATTGDVVVTVSGQASNGVLFTVAPICTSNCTLSGTVTGAWVSGVTITITGGANTTTDVNGNYSFSNLTAGTYTITPSLAGYNFSPVAPTIDINSNYTQNFSAASLLTSYSISGTVFYSGAQAGPTYINVYPCSGCNAIGGTTLLNAPSPGGTAYTIRGLPATGGGGGSNYFVRAEIDTMNTGVANASDPAGNSSTFALASNVTGVNMTVVAQTPLAPQQPSAPNVFPSSGAAFIAFNNSTDSNNDEIATSYKIYYGTDTNASNLTPVTVKAGNQDDLYILSGLADTTNYYFKMTAVNGNGESTPSSIVGPVLIGATSGNNTVSGTVTFTGTASGPLYVGLFSQTLGVYFQRFPTPASSPVTYSVSGIPSGNYQIFGVMDQNADGTVDVGDVTNFSGSNGPPPLVVGGDITNQTIALGAVSGANTVAATMFVTTSHNGFSFQSDNYSINLGIDFGTKLPISMTLFSGPNAAVPFDMTATPNSDYQPIFNNSVSPNMGDTYQFLVTFSDGSTQVLSATVTAVLTSSSFPQNLTMITTGLGSPTVPVLSWSAPTTPPAFLPYVYEVSVNGGSDNENWNYPNHSNGIPSTTTSVQYNVDGSANPNSPLIVGQTYNWEVQVQDADGNSASYTTTYLVP